jgi:Imm-5 like putative immunity protein
MNPLRNVNPDGGRPGLRDRRFVAVHRGGPLELASHRLLAAWAANCAEHVLSIFEACRPDNRPRVAIETAKAWARGEVSVGAAQKAAVRAHAAAREVTSHSATAVARAAGHAAATAHMADHCLGASAYAVKAVEAVGASAEVERAWQLEQLPEELRDLVVSALHRRSTMRRRGRSVNLAD